MSYSPYDSNAGGPGPLGPIGPAGPVGPQGPEGDMSKYLPLAGGQMEGFISLNADPSQPLHAVTKRFLDSELAAVTGAVELLGIFDATASTIVWNSNAIYSGDALPDPVPDLQGKYLICGIAGPNPPVGAPPDPYYFAGNWLICNGVDAWFHIVIDTTFTADEIPVNPEVAGSDNVQGALEAMLPKAGGTMTGPLVLATDPANNLEAATKQYVDRSNPLAGPIPPANPEPGELWFDSVTLQLYVWYDDGTSAQWVVAINQAPYIPPLDFLPISGGTLTGPLIGTSASFDDITAKNNVNATNAVGTNSLILNCITQTGSYINGYNNSKVRWSMGFIDRASETGGNAGSHFTISRYNDAGGYIDTPLHLNRTNGAATFSSNVDVVGGILTVGNYSSNGYLGLNSARGATSYIQGNKNGAVRWQLALGDSAVESGGNVGSNLSLAAFDDAGGYLSTPIQINRASGSVFLPKAQVGAWASQPNDIVHKAYVDNVIVPVADGAVPVGGVIAFAGPTIPPNYLLCNGAQYLPSDAPALFNAIGGYYFWDGVKFGVPYLYDRVPVGAGYSWGLAAAGGEINHTLSVHELAHHAHGLYDPAHIHGLPDPGHNHGFADPGHAHGAVQDGHNHGNWEDAHQHNTHMNQSNGYGIGQYLYMNPLGNVGGSDWASDWRQCGVYSDVRQPGTYTYGAGTGAWNYAAGTGQWVDWGGTRCSIYGEGGNGAHNNMPPFVAMYWIIRYR